MHRAKIGGQRSQQRIVALIASVSMLAAVSIAPFVIGGFGGPLNYILIPGLSVVAASAAGFLVFLPIGLLAERFSLRRWTQVVAASTALLLTIFVTSLIYASGTSEGEGGWFVLGVFGGGCGLYLVGGFLTYLCSLTALRRAQSISPSITPEPNQAPEPTAPSGRGSF